MAKDEKVDYVHKFEKGATAILIVMMVIVITLSIADLGYVLIRYIFSPPVLILDINELLDIFSTFLLVLIGIELIETLKIYYHRHGVRTEVIILVALIALSRKVITLDFKEMTGASMLGIAALIISLGSTYFIIRRARAAEERPHDHAQKTPAPSIGP
jgi:uncharacterized membrane protein (DUF373 family)